MVRPLLGRRPLTFWSSRDFSPMKPEISCFEFRQLRNYFPHPSRKPTNIETETAKERLIWITSNSPRVPLTQIRRVQKHNGSDSIVRTSSAKHTLTPWGRKGRYLATHPRLGPCELRAEPSASESGARQPRRKAGWLPGRPAYIIWYNMIYYT